MPGHAIPPIYRGSTMLHVDTADRLHDGSRMYEQSDTYGVYGNSTHHALENLIVQIEGGTRCQLTSSGLSACTTALLAYLKAGDHCLVPDSVYGSTREFIDNALNKFGIDTQYYDPALDAAGMAPLFRPNTTVLYLESPGSHTFEVQDVRPSPRWRTAAARRCCWTTRGASSTSSRSATVSMSPSRRSRNTRLAIPTSCSARSSSTTMPIGTACAPWPSPWVNTPARMIAGSACAVCAPSTPVCGSI